MESKTNYTMVGIAVVLLTIGLVIAGLWLSVGFDRKTYRFYTVYMRESIAGLNEDSLVRYNGVKVGVVDEIALDKANPQGVRLLIKLEDTTPVFANTRATLVTQGITGTNYLGLSATSAAMVPLKTPPGEAYPVIPYEPSFLNQLQTTVTELSARMKQFMSQENSDNFKKSLTNLQRLTTVFAKNEQALNDTLREMPQLAKQLKESITHFGKMSVDLSSAGKQLGTTMQSGQEVIDAIARQALPPTVSLLHRLDGVAANLEEVSAAMRRNPAVLIRGTTPPPKGPGE